jgi:uncharacterized SAM-binding protein YcdF (DUF218 family)
MPYAVPIKVTVFFVLSKTMPLIFYPLPVAFIGLLVVAVHYRKRFARPLLVVLLSLFYIVSIPLTSDLLMRWIEVPRSTRTALRRSYDVAVVLAGMVDLRISNGDFVEYNESIDRILQGMRLVQSNQAAVLLISGGSGMLADQSVRESPLLAEFAARWGLSRARIIVESESRNTHENARYSAEIIRRRGFQKILLVTSAFHMRRALACFRKQGLDPDILPVDFRSAGGVDPGSFIPSSGALELTRQAMREIMGLLAYKVRGYI